jgi:hypothetical protein
MPSIPIYGFDELEPSVLNTAKRRIVGLMDTSQEALTERPAEDPTNGKQNTFVEQLTEEIYTTIKEIEILDTYISETSSMGELRNLDLSDPTTFPTYLKSLKPELKKSASQILSVNNTLRKINATYDRLRPNMVYTSLKIFTFFVNSVKILKKSALRFFEIVDELIANIKRAIGDTTYTRPTINKDEDPEIGEEPPIPSDAPPIIAPSTPLPPIPDIASPPPPPRPISPPPPRKPYKGNFGKKMKEYQALIAKLIQDNNISDQNDADLITNYALDYVRANTAFLTEQEIQDYIDNQILNPPQLPIAPIAPIAPAPSTAPQFNYTQQELDNLLATISAKLPSNLTSDQKTEIQTAWMDLVQNSIPDLPTEVEIDDMLDNIIDNPFSQAPTQQASSSAITPIDKLLEDADRVIDSQRLHKPATDSIRRLVLSIQNRIKNQKDTSAKEKELKELLDLANAPFITSKEKNDTKEFKKKYPDFGKIYTDYKRERRNNNSNISVHEDKLLAYMRRNSIEIKMVDMI